MFTPVVENLCCILAATEIDTSHHLCLFNYSHQKMTQFNGSMGPDIQAKAGLAVYLILNLLFLVLLRVSCTDTINSLI